MTLHELSWIEDDLGDRFDRCIDWLLIVMLAFMPLVFGVVDAWSEELVLLLVAAMSLCFLAKIIVTKRAALTWTWAYIPIIVFLAIATIQLVPWPASWVRLISPNTALRKVELLSDLPHSEQLLSWMNISFYPYATTHDLRLVFAVAVVFVVVLNVYRRTDQIVRLLGAISIIGAGIAVLALAQNICGNDKIYWYVTSPHGVANSGPFVNHSHYAQFMNLSVAAAIGLLFVKVRQAFLHRPVTLEAVVEYLSAPEARMAWALVAMIVIGSGTVFLSLSRGGVVSILVAATFTTLVLSTKRSLRGSGWAIALLALGAFVCVLYVGFDAVCDRLATLGDLNEAEGGRWQMLGSIAMAWTRFPLLGTGLGTHEVVYPEFDRSTTPAIASHAENEYAQVTEEMGILGLLALVAFGIFVWTHYVRAVRSERVGVCWAAFGLGFGLVAILVHSLSDFGQHLPANAMLSAVSCALLIRLSVLAADETGAVTEPEGLSIRSQRLGVGVLAALCLLWGVILWGGDRARAAESHWAKVLAAEHVLMDSEWQGSDEQYARLLRHAEKAVDYQPGNIKYRHWLNVYRWHSISRMTDPNTGEIALTPVARTFVERIADEFDAARALCPTFGATWCVLGQLECAILDRPEEGKRHVRQGVKLAPCDPTARYAAGLLEAEEGHMEVASALLARAVRLDRGFFRDVATQLVDRFDQPDVALAIAGDDVDHLRVIELILAESDERSESSEKVRQKIMALIERRSVEPDAPGWVFAVLAQARSEEGRVVDAIEYYRLALSKDYGRVDWRFARARLLAQTGAVQEAMLEANKCLQARPKHSGVHGLIDALSRDPRVTEEPARRP